MEEILRVVRRPSDLCVAFYGHPGVFVYPGHEALARARDEGYPARMLPAVSAADCLFADLGIDPGRVGWQSYDATDFLIRGRALDPTAGLVLWQVGGLGQIDYAAEPSEHVPLLVERLARDYPADHLVTLYEASPWPVAGPVIEHVPLSALASAALRPMTTVYLPPASPAEPDLVMLERLGLTELDLAEMRL